MASRRTSRRAAPVCAERERLRLQLAHALFNGRRYDAAERQFLAIVENASSAAVAAEALFFAGRSQYRDGRTSEGRRTFARVASRYPGQPATARALFIEADLAQDDENFEDARAGFRRAVDTGTGVEEVGFAAMRLGGMAMANGNFEQAIREFEDYRRRWPEGRRWAQATYWSAVAHEKLGRSAEAAARLREVRRTEPISYYGGRAADKLGEAMLAFPMKPAPSHDAAARAAVEDALARYDLLRELGWADAAAYELEQTRSRFAGRDNTAYALAESLNERGLATTGIALGWDLFRRGGGWNPRLLRIIHPFPFRTMIVAEATELGVDPFLAAGLIRRESMFLPTARSGANAHGLMQVVPETGEQIARGLDMPLFTRDMLSLPEINVMLGMRYLADQLESWDARLPLVLGAYNAGPHRVRRWQEFPEIADDELFAERIPFEETREYVKIVQQNARLYAELWSE
jgi:soluble lytic murein transglycosylase